jgi:antitoxin (DNA-binding transcriptional repressor) of toxin-antitoxin stability system
MITPVSYPEAKRRLRDLIAAAARGEIVLIQENQTIVQLVPVSQTRPHPKFGSAKGLVHIADDFDAPLDDFEEYTR